MTTRIIIQACCPEDKRVRVGIVTANSAGEPIKEFFLQNGDEADEVVYGDLVISVIEVDKPASG